MTQESDRHSAGAKRPKTLVIGGGLAGLAATIALLERGLHVELIEAKSFLGGRTASFRDPNTKEMVDHCQHVGMACCTNLIDFSRRVGNADKFCRHRTLHFFGPDGSRYDMTASPRLPAPLHLLPSLLKLGYLTWWERIGVCRAMLKLARTAPNQDDVTAGAWLRAHGQSPSAIERFWAPVIVSALGEAVERASLKYMRKVFVDGFMSHETSYQIDVPIVPLDELYDVELITKLYEQEMPARFQTPVRRVDAVGENSFRVHYGADGLIEADAVVVATTWRKAAELLSPELRERWPECERWSQLVGAPITAVHLWFDHRITPLPHAVLVGALSQWFFAKPGDSVCSTLAPPDYYCQVVISASYDLAKRDKDSIVRQVVSDLQAVFPGARKAKLLRSKIVTEPEAVFSVGPGVDAIRPAQTSPIPGLFVAGDWTATGWPATMEGAVRSGYLAAEGVLRHFGREERIVVDDLPRGRWVQRLLRLG